MCILVSRVPGIPFLYDWLTYHCGGVIYFDGWIPPPPPPNQYIFNTIRLQVSNGMPRDECECAGVGYDIIHVYVDCFQNNPNIKRRIIQRLIK